MDASSLPMSPWKPSAVFSMRRISPIPISSSVPAASSGYRISCSGSRPIANWCSCRLIGRISTALRLRRQSTNTSSANAGSAAWSRRPGPESVADIDPVSGPGEGGRPVPMVASNLTLRIASAAVMAPLALLTAYLGGWIFTLFWAVAAIAVLWEWVSLVTGPVWIIVGIAYAGTLWLAPMLLRADAADGFFAIVLLFAIVWTTDVLGYFVGRAIGGPKLMPAVSPKKTWSGAIAGALGAMIVGGLVAKSFELVDGTAVAVIALLLSMVAQLGDLFESWIKRKFGAKDASHLIPGHGGVMDRLDGFWAAALVGCLIGLLRGGVDGVATGLLVW